MGFQYNPKVGLLRSKIWPGLYFLHPFVLIRPSLSPALPSVRSGDRRSLVRNDSANRHTAAGGGEGHAQGAVARAEVGGVSVAVGRKRAVGVPGGGLAGKVGGVSLLSLKHRMRHPVWRRLTAPVFCALAWSGRDKVSDPAAD